MEDSTNKPKEVGIRKAKSGLTVVKFYLNSEELSVVQGIAREREIPSLGLLAKTVLLQDYAANFRGDRLKRAKNYLKYKFTEAELKTARMMLEGVK